MNLEYDVNKSVFVLAGAEKDLIDDHCNKLNACSSSNTSESHARKKRVTNQQPEFHGAFTEIVEVDTDQQSTSGVRKSSRKRKVNWLC